MWVGRDGLVALVLSQEKASRSFLSPGSLMD